MFYWSLLGATAIIFEILGIISAVKAILTARTSQGAIAWTLALITWPFISVPLFWIFGRDKFRGYIDFRRSRDSQLHHIIEDLEPHTSRYYVDLGADFGDARVLEELTDLPFTCGNDTKLLIDGEATFEAIFDGIDRAEEYVLAEFFIVHDDDLGNEFKDRLIAAAKRGCRVYLLYDDVGSRKMTRSYQQQLRAEGVEVTGMKTTQGRGNRFQINFRNHRKIVVIDGKEAFVGGHNVGDEYVHRDKKLTPWRDTHMHIIGPATMAAQLSFVEDWNWATGKLLDLNWKPRAAPDGDDKYVFVLPSGPDDEYETCSLFFTHCINTAQKRIWIASPYFVPDEAIIKALQLAAMRGVDVRVIIPGLPDKWLVKRAAMAYVPAVTEAGVNMYEYGQGFLHQKVVLVDDLISVVGTANFDNRSFRLNFEISVVTIDEDFACEIEKMLLEDFDNSTQIDPEAKHTLFFHTSSKVARLFSPIL